jgi:hypothetical protein
MTYVRAASHPTVISHDVPKQLAGPPGHLARHQPDHTTVRIQKDTCYYYHRGGRPHTDAVNVVWLPFEASSDGAHPIPEAPTTVIERSAGFRTKG